MMWIGAKLARCLMVILSHYAPKCDAILFPKPPNQRIAWRIISSLCAEKLFAFVASVLIMAKLMRPTCVHPHADSHFHEEVVCGEHAGYHGRTPLLMRFNAGEGVQFLTVRTNKQFCVCQHDELI